jgi:signal recognition particle subunit SRP19
MGKKNAVRIKQVGPKHKAMPDALVNPMEALQIPENEMVHIPPPVDRKYQIFWPIFESLTMETTGFQVIYPSYMDSTKTIKQGRRIAADLAVERPTVTDLSQALQQLQVRHVIQPYKGYSRDITCQWENPGRILFDVKTYTKKELLVELAKRIPDLPARNYRLQQEVIEQKRLQEEMAAAQASEAANAKEKSKTVSVTVGSTKKKGKKGKKK